MVQSTPGRRPRAASLAARLGSSSMASRLEDEVRLTAAGLADSVAEAKLKVSATRYKVVDEVRNTADKLKSRVRKAADEAKAKLGDDARFLKSWIDSPGRTGAVAPSSPFLARRMASFVDPQVPGPVVEIGPGTGPVTEALIARGVAEERLVLVEFSPEFCELLRNRFPRATVIEGDAYALSRTLADRLEGRAAAVVSSLPLFNRPPPERLRLVRDAFDNVLTPGGPFIQFTYAMISPIPRKGSGLKSQVSDWVLRNIPPARVWVYRRPAA
ncbi:methyltransferase domain-containing protein [Bosea sp. TWI1241]|jgi:phosphatidylethanolamine/phosphatidyl-N-methylethanolamine N-methyltransferase|uniref:class I SAM-dependent methyltransferase n=1 Tax=Bosea sp. TWI1241 TaxID=3148904 RepID=UPI003208A8AD